MLVLGVSPWLRIPPEAIPGRLLGLLPLDALPMYAKAVCCDAVQQSISHCRASKRGSDGHKAEEEGRGLQPGGRSGSIKGFT